MDETAHPGLATGNGKGNAYALQGNTTRDLACGKECGTNGTVS